MQNFIEIRSPVRNLKIPHFSNFLELPPPPQLPKREWIRFGYVNHYLGLVLIFLTKFHPDPSTLSVFQDFRFPPPNSPQCPQIQSGFEITTLRHDFLPNIKLH